MSGRKPYGRNETEQAVIARMRRLRNIHHGRRKSFCDIANLLNEQHAPPPSGLRWYGTTVKNILERDEARSTHDARRTKSGIEPDDYLNVEQVGMVLRSLQAERSSADAVGTSRAVHRQMLILTLLWTGLRNQELCDLTIQDMPVWHGKDQVRVRCGKGRKGRTIHIASEHRALLDEYCRRFRDCKKATDYVFKNRDGGKFSTDSVRGIVSGVGRRAGLAHFHPHMLRHTMATLQLLASKDTKYIQDQLGHANIATTNIYVGAVAELRKTYSAQYARILQGAADGVGVETL